MIEAIYWLAIFAVVLVNVTGLTLLTLRYVPFPAIARATGIILVCLALFSLEHCVGLGELYTALPAADRAFALRHLA